MKEQIITGLISAASLVTLLTGCSRPDSAPAPSPTYETPPPLTPTVSPAPVPRPTTASPAPSAPPPVPAKKPTPTVSPAPQIALILKVSQPADGAILKSNAVAVKGQTKAGATVSINDKVVLADSRGNFSATVTVDDGVSAIEVIATDGAGNRAETVILVNVTGSPSPSKPSPTGQAGPPSTGLPLTILQPVDGATVNFNRVTVRGQTAPGATVNVNDQVTVADARGNFAVPIDLFTGPNAIDIVASYNGNENSVFLIVEYEGE